MYFHSNGAVSSRMSQKKKKKHLLPRPHYAEWHGFMCFGPPHPTPPPIPIHAARLSAHSLVAI